MPSAALPGTSHWGCMWDVTAVGVMVPGCLSAARLSVGELALSQLSTAMALQPSRQASTPEISQTQCHTQRCPLSQREELGENELGRMATPSGVLWE